MSKYITLVEGNFVCNIPIGMTNGEVIQTLFPNMKVYEYTEKVVLNGMGNEFQIQSMAWKNWWNAPYQKGGDDET